MDVNDYIFGNGVVDPAQQAQMAQALRQREGQGAIMALTGDTAATPVGNEYMKQAGQQRNQGLQHNYYQGMLRNQEEALKMRKYEADLNHKAQMARTGAMASKEKSYRPIPGNVQEKLLNDEAALLALDKLKKTRLPSMDSSFPGSGAARTLLGKMPDSMNTAGIRDYRQWRRNLEAWFTAPNRHELFGGALTAPEIQNWALQALDPDASTEQVHRAIDNIVAYIAPKHAGRISMNVHNYGPTILDDIAYMRQTSGEMETGMPEGEPEMEEAPVEDARDWEVEED